MNLRRWVYITPILYVLSSLLSAVSGQSSIAESSAINFSRDVKPILAAACFQCHGPDEETRGADLRLDVADGVEAVFSGGDLESSEAWTRINSSDDAERMPPPEADHQLSREEKSVLANWIEQGADWESHWSFLSPRSPSLPVVQSGHPIDQFLDQRIEEMELQRMPPANRARLLRRITYDLTGLPPTLAQIDNFLVDQESSAYEKVVDRLLSSPRFGERMAVAWLDAARYGDTSVFHGDGPRDMWAWRDWVINAYNDNKPFDQFTVEQLAGDLLPNATIEQQIASGFNRNNATTDEGGAIAEEFRVEYAVDRVKTTSMVWLGLTMECAQCHDHKYDPISQEEYYKFFAYFNQSADAGMQTRNGNAVPTVDVPNYTKAAELATIEQELRRIQRDLDNRKAAAEGEFSAWVAEVQSLEHHQPLAPNDMVTHFAFDEASGEKVNDAIRKKHEGKIHGKPTWTSRESGHAIGTGGNRFVDLGNVGDFERGDGFSYGCWIKPTGKTLAGAPIARMEDGNNYRGYDLYLQNGQVGAHLIHAWPDNALKVMSKKKLGKDRCDHGLITSKQCGFIRSHRAIE
jgi:hypothetical protein